MKTVKEKIEDNKPKYCCMCKSEDIILLETNYKSVCLPKDDCYVITYAFCCEYCNTMQSVKYKNGMV